MFPLSAGPACLAAGAAAVRRWASGLATPSGSGPAHRLWKALSRPSFWPSVNDPGYTKHTGLSLSLGDLNGDGREDLIVRHNEVTGMQAYAVYLQTADDQFNPQPVLTYESVPDWRTWLCWVDINRDGKVDLIKSTWLDEPWFLPGTRSGKVLVGAYLADGTGRLPAEPQQSFREK